jgi:hypothetical protein
VASRARRRFGGVALGLSIALLASCEPRAAPSRDGGTMRDATRDAPEPDAGLLGTFETVYPTLSLRCATCHSGPMASGGLDLGGSRRRVYAALVGPDRASTDASCSDMPIERVTPSDPDASFLFRKVAGTQGACGMRMPPGGSLTPRELAAIEAWIAAGAPPP